MIITDASLQLASSHQLFSAQSHQETLRAWQDDPAAKGGRRELDASSSGASLQWQISAAQLAASMHSVSAPAPVTAVAASDASAGVTAPAGGSSGQDGLDLRTLLIKLLLERLTGQKFTVYQGSDGTQALPASTPGATPAASDGGHLGWGLVYNSQDSVQESESLRFSAQGSVHTADGRDIQISLQLNMDRSYVSQNNISLRAGDALKDPLVVNFGGNATSLTQDHFAFDINADGKVESVPFVGAGSGFLALDRNGNGRIDDGSELFGTRSGNGFADLARYDSNGNGWIDGNDPIFSHLLVWSRDASGASQLQSLAQLGIGAIALGHTSSPFALKDAANALQGAVRSTGLFLREDGSAGSLQQVDLVA